MKVLILKLLLEQVLVQERPLHPQFQHIGDLTIGLRQILHIEIEIIVLKEPEDVYISYKKAYERQDGKSTILVEYGDYYNEK